MLVHGHVNKKQINKNPCKSLRNIKSKNMMSTFRNIGHSLTISVERFITIGEIIAEENIDIKVDMYEAVIKARESGKSIQKLCDVLFLSDTEPLKDYGAIFLAAKSLLSSVTRILLIVDIIVVKKLLTLKKRETESFEKLESIMNFTEFVRAFTFFGTEMIELACILDYNQNSCIEERRRSQLFSARQILEKSISILLTSSKNSLIHSDCVLVKENRDTVFCQIRRAMDLIHFVIKDSIFNSSKQMTHNSQFNSSYINESINTIIVRIIDLIEKIKKQSADNNCSIKERNNNFKSFITEHDAKNCISRNISNKSLKTGKNIFENLNHKDELFLAIEKLCDKIHDFTDSPYVSHAHRNNILIACDKSKEEIEKYLYQKTESQHDNNEIGSLIQDMGSEMDMLRRLQDLYNQLVISVLGQIEEFNRSLSMCMKIVKSFYILAMTDDIENLSDSAINFNDCCDHIFDICKLLRHIAPSARLEEHAKSLAINLRIYGPQVFLAAKILWKHSNSSSANDNFKSFLDMWNWVIAEISLTSKNIFASINANKLDSDMYAEKCESKNQSTKQNIKNQCEIIENLESEGKDNSNSGAYQIKWADDLSDDNDILKRAKNLSAMAFLMYQFTKGNGSLRTTQDLFTQAEYFAEEANRLYKVIRHFSYQVPASENKKELLNILDRVPTFVQALQFTVKEHTVGKAATFVKVDHVIRETKNLMSVINKVVSACFECATKFKLNLSGISGGLSTGAARGDDNVSGGMCDTKGTASSNEGNM